MNTRRIAGTIGSDEKSKTSQRFIDRLPRRDGHWCVFFVAAFFFIGAAAVPSSRSQTPQTAPPANPSTQLDRDAILHHLNAVITWYRDITSKVKPVGLPSDAIYQDNTRSLAAEAVRLAFQSARAEAAIITAMNKFDKPGSPDSAQGTNPQPTQQQNLAQTAAKIAAQIDD